MQEPCDVIIIGSGPAGVHAARALIDAGRTVTMLDGGEAAPEILSQSEVRDFPTMRREDVDQWKLFLGEDMSNIPLSGMEGGHGGGMAAGNRSYVTRGTDKLLPTRIKDGLFIQSLAQGGLAAAWGATCAYFNDTDLTAMGLSPDGIHEYEDAITQEIGISGPDDKAHMQPPVEPDHHAAAILRRSAINKKRLERLNVEIRQPCTAVLTRDMGERRATSLQDLDYYADPGRSVYRPHITLERLKSDSRFSYIPHIVIQHIEETGEACVVFGRTADDPAPRRWTAKRVVVAAGAVNTARILMQSMNLFDTPVSIVTKPHAFVPCLHPVMLGKAGPDKRLSLCQLVAIDRTPALHGMESACAQLYSYRSLLNMRLLPAVPLPVPQSMGLLSLLSPALIIADVRFPGLIRRDQTMSLGRDGVLDITFLSEQTDDERRALRRIRKALRTAGLLPLQTIDLPGGSSSHYAGTVPVSNDTTLPLACDKHGHVRGMRHVYVADAAMFRMLPPLPHTLTIMANARRIGQVVANSLN